MSRYAIAPTVECGRGHGADPDEIHRHPAYGLVQVSRVTGQTFLFGSELSHSAVVRVTIREAVGVLSYHSMRHREGRVIAQWEMSEAQWAAMVSSHGIGCGTPITYTRKPDADTVQSVAEILPPNDGVSNIAAAELQARMAEQIAELQATLAKMGEAIDTGGKKAQRELLRNMGHMVANLPANTAFAMEVFKKNADAIAAAAKTDIEAFASAVVTQTGLDAIAAGHMPSLPRRRGDDPLTIEGKA